VERVRCIMYDAAFLIQIDAKEEHDDDERDQRGNEEEAQIRSPRWFLVNGSSWWAGVSRAPNRRTM
jgi:hypothetical protein